VGARFEVHFSSDISPSGFPLRCGVKVKSAVANVPFSYCYPGKWQLRDSRFAALVADGRLSGGWPRALIPLGTTRDGQGEVTQYLELAVRRTAATRGL
jgi:hypothetical protein